MIYHDISIEQTVSRKEHRVNTLYTILCGILIAWMFFLEVATLNLAYSVFIVILILMIFVLQRTKKVVDGCPLTRGSAQQYSDYHCPRLQLSHREDACNQFPPAPVYTVALG